MKADSAYDMLTQHMVCWQCRVLLSCHSLGCSLRCALSSALTLLWSIKPIRSATLPLHLCEGFNQGTTQHPSLEQLLPWFLINCGQLPQLVRSHRRVGSSTKDAHLSHTQSTAPGPQAAVLPACCVQAIGSCKGVAQGLSRTRQLHKHGVPKGQTAWSTITKWCTIRWANV